MQIFNTTAHSTHAPGAFIFRGERVPCPEVPARVDLFMAALEGSSHQFKAAGKPNDTAIAAVHDAGYLRFLSSAWDEWSAIPGHSDEVMPNVHPGRQMWGKPDTVVGQAGYYQADCACPIGPGTFEAVRHSAQCAVDAAHCVIAGEADFAYAMCRPPGHHAFADLAGGFCFLNNSAIAAQQCVDSGHAKVAVLDIDVHHGNGTQGIFYDRADVLTVSLHGDPANYYPYYAGYTGETGEGAGAGFNINHPLPRGTADDAYMESLAVALEQIDDFDPSILIVALGLDASVDDPLAWLAITTDGFSRIATRLRALGLPSILVQEGGYISDVLGQNLRTFLDSFEAS